MQPPIPQSCPPGSPGVPVPASPRPSPLIPLRPYSVEPFWRDELGLMFLLWRRQSGKTYTMASRALRRMMERPGLLVTFASASINVGAEMIQKEALVWSSALSRFKEYSEANGKHLTCNGDGVDFDGLCDLFEHQKLEARIWHSRTSYSRTKIIAPNVATARGYTGDVFLDEIGFIQDFKELWEAMEPIMQSDPAFRCMMATTPPADDAHFSYELAAPEPGTEFLAEQASAEGRWYQSQTGLWVHRLDAWDAEKAGIHLYDTNTRKPIDPTEHRAKAIDRAAWDRNYGLIFTLGGTAACSLMGLQHAMDLGRHHETLAHEGPPPAGWEKIIGDGRLSIGLDPATTEGEKSNPTGLAVLEEVGSIIVERLVCRYKAANPDEHKAILRDLVASLPRKPRRLVIDGSNERFFARDIKTMFAGICMVEIIVSGETTEYLGERMSWKTYLGNLITNRIDDGLLAVPPSRWLKNDFRSVIRNKGGFANQLDSAGNHGDCFDASKNALHGLVGKGGPATADASGTGSMPYTEKTDPYDHPDDHDDQPVHGISMI